MLGDCVTGVIAASYGGFMTAVLDTWRPTSIEEWSLLSPLPYPDVLTDFDTNRWTVDAIPDLGGNAYYYTGDPIITGVRLVAPPKDPHTFHTDRKAEKEGKPKTVKIDDEEKRKSSRRRDDRAKSCTRYTSFRETVNEPAETRGQHRSSERGRKTPRRNRSPVYLR